MKLPIADTHDRVTIPRITLEDDPTERMFQSDIDDALKLCLSASERAIRVASSSKMKVSK